MARLSQAPNTVTIFDVGEHGGRPYIVMEYLPGGSLADRLEREGAQPIGRTLDWLGQAAAALDVAHAHGIVHRDVKPGNLLLDNDERVKVADFGVASATDLGSFTEAGTVVGTAGYLAPEQARGERATPAERPLRARRRRLRAADREAPVRARLLDGGGDRARERTDPAGVRLEPDVAAGARRRARARPRQGAGAPVCLRGRFRRRAARRPRPGGRHDAGRGDPPCRAATRPQARALAVAPARRRAARRHPRGGAPRTRRRHAGGGDDRAATSEPCDGAERR